MKYGFRKKPAILGARNILKFVRKSNIRGLLLAIAVGEGVIVIYNLIDDDPEYKSELSQKILESIIDQKKASKSLTLEEYRQELKKIKESKAAQELVRTTTLIETEFY